MNDKDGLTREENNSRTNVEAHALWDALTRHFEAHDITGAFAIRVTASKGELKTLRQIVEQNH